MANVKDLLVNGSARVIGTIYGNATSADKVNHSLTFGSKSFNGSSAQTITLADLGGKPLQSAVSSPSASGTEISFIDTISQNANGVITATKKNVRDASTSQSGVVTTGAQSFAGNKTFAGQLIKNGVSASWVNGRDNAFLRMSSINGYSPAISIKTTNGSWDIGAYNHSSYTDDLVFSYVTDTDYNSHNNRTTAEIKFLENGHIVASLDGNATSANKLSTARTISLTGSVTGSGTFDGSGNLSISTTTNHNHNGNYVLKSGDTMTGDLTVPCMHGQAEGHKLGYRHLDAGGSWPDKRLYIGYGAIYPTASIGFYLSSDDLSSRTQWAEINSNGLYANTRFGVNGQNTSYNLYVNGSSNITGNLKLDGSITNLAVNGGIYWNPYVESSSDPSDVASITVIKSGAAGGTELRIQQANDSGDIINLVSPAYIYFNSKPAFQINDSWLRLNPAGSFSNGTHINGNSYFNGSIYLPDEQTIYQNQRDTSNYTSIVGWLKGATTQKDANGNAYAYQPQIGQHNIGGTDNLGSITILPYATNTEPWSQSAGLYITKNKLLLDNCRIPTTGNTSGSVGSSTQPVYLNNGIITAITGSIANNITGSSASCTGNAATATKLATARTISLTGSVTGSGTFDGSGNLSISTTTNHNHDGNYVKKTGDTMTGALTINATTNDGSLKITSHGNTLSMGSMNTGYCHFQNSADIPFYFNKTIYEDGNLLPYQSNTFDLGNSSHYWRGLYASTLYGTSKDVDVASYRTTAGTKNYILIKINNPSYYMTAFTVRAYQSYNLFDVTFSGYQYGTNYWYSPRAALGSDSTVSSLTVYFGYNSTNEMWVALPGLDYTGVKVMNVVNGYQPLDITSAFSITRVSSLPGTLQSTQTIYRPWIRGESVTGAVWNDYAEYREADTIQGGRCVREVGDDTLALTTKRLMRGCSITSDTWGFAQGETDKAKTPIAVAGRVLAYPLEDRELFKEYIGYSVCSGPDGTVSLMTEEEELKYPWAIVGTVSAVPDYEEWGGGEMADRPSVKVDGRIWIKVK